MTLTDREKALVEAARKIRETGIRCELQDELDCLEHLETALRAYDPPKPKVPVLPEFQELDYETRVAIQDAIYTGKVSIAYGTIRELTAKDSA